MSAINELIATALDRDLPDTPDVAVAKKRGRQRFTAILFVLLLFVVVYEYEHIKIGMGLHSDPIDVSPHVDEMYEAAISIMSTRFERGQMLISPFNDAVLDNWLGVTYLGDGEYLLYYMGASADHPIPARKVKFSW